MLSASHIIFFLLAALAVISALFVVINPNPVRSALYLVVTFLSVAALYISMSAQFIAAVQIIVYAGAIMVLFLFVIMLLNLSGPDTTQKPKGMQAGMARLFSVILLTLLCASPLTTLPARVATPEQIAGLGTVSAIGNSLYSPNLPWLFPFEITSILLLVAVVGAIVLAKRRI